jgi:chromosome segregation ATPase
MMVTIDELAERMRFVETDMRSEKDFARTQLEQSIRNGAALASLTTRFDQLAGDASAARGELRMQSTILPILQQDVSAIRQDVTALRRGQEELHARIDGVESKLDAILAILRAQ